MSFCCLVAYLTKCNQDLVPDLDMPCIVRSLPICMCVCKIQMRQCKNIDTHANQQSPIMCLCSYLVASVFLKDTSACLLNSTVSDDIGSDVQQAGVHFRALAEVKTYGSYACAHVFVVDDRVDLPGMFGGKGIEDAKERVELVVGDVMQPFPDTVQKAGVDTLVMKHFLSAFNDKDAILILKHCSQVLAPQGKLLLLQVCTITTHRDGLQQVFICTGCYMVA